jgi:hypothetical protein
VIRHIGIQCGVDADLEEPGLVPGDVDSGELMVVLMDGSHGIPGGVC